jgi:hypothetical protein
MKPQSAAKQIRLATQPTGLCLMLMAALLAVPALAAHGGDETFHGVIADSQCALNVHSLTQSHKEMLQGKTVGTTEADCVWYCIKERGGRFVLQNKDKVYKLDEQNIPKEYAGRKVKVVGTFESKTNTIHVKNIELLPDTN